MVSPGSRPHVFALDSGLIAEIMWVCQAALDLAGDPDQAFPTTGLVSEEVGSTSASTLERRSSLFQRRILEPTPSSSVRLGVARRFASTT